MVYNQREHLGWNVTILLMRTNIWCCNKRCSHILRKQQVIFVSGSQGDLYGEGNLWGEFMKVSRLFPGGEN